MPDETRSLGRHEAPYTRPDDQPMPDAQPNPSTADPDTPATQSGGGLPTVAQAGPPTAGDAFTLLSEIARGGMGVVHRTRDNVLGRDVAVKLLQQLHPAGSPAVRRFWGEAKITGQLQHPAIPPIYQCGTLPDGRPFLAMKLIKGDTLAALLKARTDLAADRGRFVAAFEQVCHALGYAHSRGVVHRDLKPGNVMVGAFGEVQVMDWGLAKVLAPSATAGSVPTEADDTPSLIDSERDADFVTRAGSVLGTPPYMPPEQAIGAIDQIDCRSDVFGLGAILAAILTGRPPFVGMNAESARQLAARGRVEECFARLDSCGAEPGLVALCKRCLSPEKANRPAHGGEVASAVAALRAAADERARRAEVERERAEVQAAEQRKLRRVQLTLAGAVVTIVGLVAAGAVWNEVEKRKRAATETEQRLKAANAAERARNLLGLASELRKEYRFDAAEDALKQAGELTEKFAPDLTPQVEQAKFDLRFARDLDRIRMKRSTWIAELGGKGHFDMRGAPEAYQKAFASRGLDVVTDALSVGDRVASSAVRTDLVTALDDWAILLPDEEADLRRKVLATANRADPDSGAAPFRDPTLWKDVARLQALAALADVPRMSPGAVVAVAELIHFRRGHPEKLLRHAMSLRPREFLIAFELGQTLPEDDPERMGAYRAARALRPDNTTILNNLGATLVGKGDVDGAVAAFREAIRIDPDARGHSNLGVALVGKGDVDGAVAAFREAIRIDPDARGHSNLGVALAGKGDVDGAVAAYREAIRIDPKLAQAHYNLGVGLRDKGNLDGAVAACREAVRLDPKYAWAHGGLGNALRDKGDVDGAVAAYREAIRLDPKLALAHLNLGIALDDKRDLDGAVAAYREAIRLDPKLALAHFNLGAVLDDKRDLDGAVAAYREAVRIDPKYARAHTNLGNSLRGKGDVDGAVAAYREAIRLDPKAALPHYNLGNALKDKRDLDGAVAAYREAIRLDPKFTLAHLNLGIALAGKGDVDGAVAACREAVRIDPRHADAHANLGVALLGKGDLRGAAAALEEAVKLGPRNSVAHQNLGAVYLELKMIPEATACARAAIRADPKFATAHAFLGHLLQQAGDIPGARAALTEAARLDPRWKPMLAKLPPVPVAPPPRAKP